MRSAYLLRIYMTCYRVLKSQRGKGRCESHLFGSRPMDEIPPKLFTLHRHLHFGELLVLDLERQDIRMVEK